MEKYAISMFSGGGVSDAGIEHNGIKIIVGNEIVPDRAALFALNHPKARVFVEDAWKCYQEICDYSESKIGNGGLFMLLATPPCQGMSKNGAGKLLSNIRKGLRPQLDTRNRLIIPALNVAKTLKPKWVVFENVPSMRNTVIEDEEGAPINIIDLVKRGLSPDYDGRVYVVEFADYGLPQRRSRLITVFSRSERAKKFLSEGGSFIPPKTHSKDERGGLRKWVTVREALRGFEWLDSKNRQSAASGKDSLHRVSVMDPKKYEWISHTPENASAFDNQCTNPDCGYAENPVHGARRNHQGINQANKDTPLYCVRCGSLLPRPYTEKNGVKRIMSGYTSAYKRMAWDLPASTLTRNFSFACSDNKVHPEQNRVLSLAEASKLQSISDYGYRWGPLVLKGKERKIAPDSLIRNVIGESAPPLFFDVLSRWILEIENVSPKKTQSSLSPFTAET